MHQVQSVLSVLPPWQPPVYRSHLEIYGQIFDDKQRHPTGLIHHRVPGCVINPSTPLWNSSLSSGLGILVYGSLQVDGLVLALISAKRPFKAVSRHARHHLCGMPRGGAQRHLRMACQDADASFAAALLQPRNCAAHAQQVHCSTTLPTFCDCWSSRSSSTTGIVLDLDCICAHAHFVIY